MRNNQIWIVRFWNSLENGAKRTQLTCNCLYKWKGTEGSHHKKQGMIQERILFKSGLEGQRADRATLSCLSAEEIQGGQRPSQNQI